MSSIEERVKKIVIEQLGVNEDQVVSSASFVDDLPWVTKAAFFIKFYDIMSKALKETTQ